MELVYDWKGFHSLFNAKKKAAASESPDPVFVVLEGKTVISAYCETEDLSDWVGAPYEEVLKGFAHREKVVFDRRKVEEWMGDAMSSPHFPEEIQCLREQAQSQIMELERHRNMPFHLQGNFLLQATQSWWHKLIPSTYGLYLRLDEGKGPSLLIIIQRKKLISFFVPDLGSLQKEKQKNLPAIVRFLSEKHLIPIQGIAMTSEEWREWSDSPNPWPRILTAIRTKKDKLTPSRWGVLSLLASRAYFGF